MGKGIALQFKNAFPVNFKAYEVTGERRPSYSARCSSPTTVGSRRLTTPHWIINFPTKGHWRARSCIRDVADGLGDRFM